MTSVFADSAGDIHDGKERVVVLATLIASDVQTSLIDKRCGDLKDMLRAWGVDVDHELFEFKAYDILQGSGLWRKLDEDRRIRVAKSLRRIIWDLGLHFAVVLIDKDGGGLKGTADFNDFVSNSRDHALAMIGEERKRDLGLLIAQSAGSKGLGPLGNMTGLLFGLTTGLMHEKGLRHGAALIMDDQFVKQTGAWELIFQIHEASWPLIGESGLFPRWPKDNQPGWHLGRDLNPVDSRVSYGVQLTDFIAYTTRRVNERPIRSLADQVSVVDDCRVFRLGAYQGIRCMTSYRPPRRRTYPRKTKRLR